MDKKAKHEIIYKHIKQLIQNGIYGCGYLIPSEQSLSEQYNVSRSTVRRSLQDLKNDGYLESRKGRGYSVIYNPEDLKNSCMASFTDNAIKNGQTPQTQLLFFGYENSESISDSFLRSTLTDGIPLCKIKRLRLINDIPLLINTTWIPSEAVPGFTDVFTHNRGPDQSILRFLKKNYGLVWSQGYEQIAAHMPTKEEKKLLNFPDNKPVLCQRSVVFDQQGQFTFLEKNIKVRKIEFTLLRDKQLKSWSRS